MIHENEKINEKVKKEDEIKRRKFEFPSIFNIVMMGLCVVLPITMIVMYIIQLSYYGSKKTEYMTFSPILNEDRYTRHVEKYKRGMLNIMAGEIVEKFIFPFVADVGLRTIYWYFMPIEQSSRLEYYGEGIFSLIFSGFVGHKLWNVMKDAAYVNYFLPILMHYIFLPLLIYLICRLFKSLFPRNILRLFLLFSIFGLLDILRKLFYRQGVFTSILDATVLTADSPISDPGSKNLVNFILAMLKNKGLGDVVLAMCDKKNLSEVAKTMSSFFCKYLCFAENHNSAKLDMNNIPPVISHEIGHIVHKHVIFTEYVELGCLFAIMIIVALVYGIFYKSSSSPLAGVSTIMWLSSFLDGILFCTLNFIRQRNEFEADSYAVKDNYGAALATILRNGFYDVGDGLSMAQFAHAGHAILMTHPSNMRRVERILEQLKK